MSDTDGLEGLRRRTVDVSIEHVTTQSQLVKGDEQGKQSQPITEAAGDGVAPTKTSEEEEEDAEMTEAAGSPDLKAARKISQGTGYVPSCVRNLVSGLSPRWGNWVVRFFTTIILISSFTFLVYCGPLALVFLVLLIQLGCFSEIIHIGYVIYRSHDLPWFRSLSWYFLFTSNYFLFGESLITRFRILLAKEDFLQPLVTHHQFISFSLYCGGLVGFVLSLVKKHYLQQFMLFGWTHVTLLLIVTSSHFIMQNIFNGTIWFLIPVSMVICNDIMAYMFGFFLGKTPLIQLSPKKTWEGFIGGGIATIIFGMLFSLCLINNDHYVCPIEYDDVAGQLTTSCVRNPIFISRTYNVSKFLFMLPFRKFTWYPYLNHCFVIGLYTSIVGPFGGFFASGFKRAFKIKDFGDILPGHGGIMDRFDCQLIIGCFVFFYYNSFIAVSSPNLLPRILVLPAQEQLEFYRLLTEALLRRGVLPSKLGGIVTAMIGSSGSDPTALVNTTQT